ncbi:hypothetical protein [Paenibacillus amylolyticus]|uniref:NERD domain-containing protein n=1 Tax=Paenibacillus amylolyticus TaxID=1451 RepID=A0ABD8B1Y9_PAEAM
MTISDMSKVIYNYDDFISLASILSQLGFIDNSIYSKDCEKINEKFIKESRTTYKNEKGIIEYLEGSQLVTRHGVLLTWKHLFQNLDNYSIKLNQHEDTTFVELINVITHVQELEMDYRETDLKSYINANSFFNRYDTASHQYARTFFLFIYSPYKEGSKGAASLENLKDAFITKYQMQLESYIYLTAALVFTVLELYENNKEFNSETWSISLSSFPFKDILLDQFKQLLLEISFDLDEGKEWFVNELAINQKTHENFMFDLFTNKPFLKIDSNSYIPIERKGMEDLLFHSLYSKLLESFSKDDKRRVSFRNDFGFMLESYVSWLIVKTADYNNIYRAKEEFLYDNSSKRSPDVFLIYNDYVLVIEVKSYRVKKDVIRDYARKKSIDDSYQKNTVKPLNQIKNAMLDIIQKEITPALTADMKYYFMTIAMDNFPTANSMRKTLIEELIGFNTQFNLMGIFSLSIEEFELFVEVINSTQTPFNDYLDDYYNLPDDISFKNFINSKNKSIKDKDRRGPFDALRKKAQNEINNFFNIFP